MPQVFFEEIRYAKSGETISKYHCLLDRQEYVNTSTNFSINVISILLTTLHTHPLDVYIICESSLQNKPGFKELGSITPYDIAVSQGKKEIAAMILKKVNEDKGNKRCEFTCPPVKIGIPIQSSCYQPDLMEGTNTQSSYFQRPRISSLHNFPI